MSDLISRQAAIDAVDKYDFNFPMYMERFVTELRDAMKADLKDDIKELPSAQPEDYTELKREFIRMASYIDVLLECSDEQKETLIGFISRLAEFMPWTERD